MPAPFADALKAGYGFSGASLTLGAALDGRTVHAEPKIRIPLAPVFLADIKGDLSGLAVPGEPTDRVTRRATDVGWTWTPAGVPVEFVSLTGKLGVQLRATVASFGPLLLAKVLGLNDTQTSVLTMVFKYCDDARLPLLDFNDLRAVLRFLSGDGGKEALAGLGGMSAATVGVLRRDSPPRS